MFRELRNLVERLVIVCPQARIDRITSRPNSSVVPRKSPTIPTRRCMKPAAPMSGIHPAEIARANAGNMTQTATALGLDAATSTAK